MLFDSWWGFPFLAAGFGIMMIAGILLFAFWIWMIVDCAKRNFKNLTEKIIWLVVIVVGGWIGALVYFIVIRNIKHKGLVA
ncbi:PLDc N-terminal domain-containing protein [Candidatus Pacearchaeota archaeon]|nr:PLDc N-terminal domain-containing protein [Candidatus Pacearchaeota archaeon]